MFGPRQGKGNPTDDASAPRVAVHVESRLDANRALLDRIEHAIQPRAGLILTDLVKVCPRWMRDVRSTPRWTRWTIWRVW